MAFLIEGTKALVGVILNIRTIAFWCRFGYTGVAVYHNRIKERKILMLLELLSELFRPPYDVYQVVMLALILLFGVYTVAMVLSGFCRLLFNCETKCFFTKHMVKTGTVIRYEIIDGETYTTVSPAIPGMFSILVPRVHQTPDQFAIVLECRNVGVRFHAKYEIPSGDYKEHKKGETVCIEEDWAPIEFQVLW